MERFMQTVMDSEDAVVITTAEPEFTIVFVNKAFTTNTEYIPEEVLGRPIAVIWKHHPTSHQGNPEFIQSELTSAEVKTKIREALQELKPIRQFVTNYTKSNKPYIGELNIFPYWENGICTHFISIHKNITVIDYAQQQLKEYKKFFDETPVALLRTDIKTGEFLMANKFCAGLLGYESVDQLLQLQKSINLYPNKDIRKKLIGKIRKHGFIENHELNLYLHNGTNIWVLANLHINCGGSCIEGSMIDITYQKEVEQELVILQSKQVAKLSVIGDQLDVVLASYVK